MSEDTPEGFTNVLNMKAIKRHAITSYSVICHTIIDGQIYYLIGRVRDTIPFKEFIRGTIDDKDMSHYVAHMSQEEKYRLLTEPFQELLDDVIVNHASRAYRNLSRAGDESFVASLAKHRDILADPNLGLTEAPWIFPKGRKAETEYDVTCALREFEEETHIPSSGISIYNDVQPLEEIYTGLDGKLYKTVYFLGQIDYSIFQDASESIRSKFLVSIKRTSLSDEIAKIKWLPYQEAVDRLDKAKAYVLRMVNTFLIFHLKRTRPQRRHSI